MAPLPEPRGPASAAVLSALLSEPHPIDAVPALVPADPLADDDLHLALYLCYELHDRGLPGVSDAWEWEPSLVGFRRELERRFEGGLIDVVDTSSAPSRPEEVAAALVELSRDDGGPSLSRYLAREASLERFREFVIHRSAYHLKEADPHSHGIPRISGAPKVALVEVQFDEYGSGDPERMHAALFAKTMRALGLSDEPGAYLDAIPGSTLATVNLISLFGLHRRWRGALAGHLALFELTSSIPNRFYGNGLRRLGLGPEATDFFDEHVEADAVHDMIATYDYAAAVVGGAPRLATDVLFGARALKELDVRASSHLLASWQQGRSSLRPTGRPVAVA